MKKRIPPEYRRYLEDRGGSILGAEDAGSRLSPRGFWVGGFLCFFLAVSAPYVTMAMRGTVMAFDFHTPGAIFLFLVLIGLLNALFKIAARGRWLAVGVAALTTGTFLLYYWPLNGLDIHSPGFLFSGFLVISSLINLPVVWRGGGLALNRAELILIYVMLLVVSALCTMGLSQQLLPSLTAIFYYASPENRWAEKLFPYFPTRRVLVDDGRENAAFYEGTSSPGIDIDYGAWVEPLIWWGIFLLALYAVMVCLAVILRRQWMERERLPYPMTQVGVAMIAGENEKSLLNGFFKNTAVWCGVAIPMLFGSLIALQTYHPAVPVTRLAWRLPFVGNQWLDLRIRFAMVGFSYLINSQVAAGIWFFHLFSKIEHELLNLTGMVSSQRFVYGVAEHPFLAYQGGGALIAMVLLGLWTGREHLKSVFRKAVGRAPEIDDGDEVLSYRAATLGLVVGAAVMVGWLWLMGTKLWVALVFIAAALLIFIGITRVVAEAGLAAVRSPMIAPDLVIQGLGSQLVGASGVFNLSLAYIWCADIRVFILAMITNGLKLIEEMDRPSRRRVFWGISLAIGIGAVGSCWMVFHLAYRHGGINLDAWRFNAGPHTIYNMAMRSLNTEEVYWPGLGFFLGGGAIMLLLTWARQRLLWWPIHPIGFPIGANYLMNHVWFSVFLAWSVKRLVLRYGGAALYRTTQRFFLGLIVGEVLCNGIWIVIDYFTGQMGNVVFAIG